MAVDKKEKAETFHIKIMDFDKQYFVDTSTLKMCQLRFILENNEEI